MKVEFVGSSQSVECRECHEQIPAAEVKAKLLPVRGDERWYYYYHRRCFAGPVAELVRNLLANAKW